MANRIWWVDLFRQATSILSASSEQSSNPVAHLKDQQRQKTLRSKVGYTVTEDNRRIDFDRSGVKVATIALGYYPTQAEYAAAVVAALVAADGALTWAVDWGVAATDKFRIRDAGGAPLNFDLLWNTGANKYRSAGYDLGYSDAADDTGNTTYTADRVSYQSRLFIRLHDTDQSLGTIQAFAYMQHNFPAAMLGLTSITVQRNTTDAWSSPAFSQAYTLIQGDPFYRYDNYGSGEFWRFVIYNVCDSSGFTEVGVISLAQYIEPTYCIAADLNAQEQPFTMTQDGIAGTRFHNVQPSRDAWSIGWKTLGPTPQLKVDAFFREIPVGQNFFFDFDTTGTSQLVYVSREARSWGFVPFEYRDYAVPLIEAV